MDGAQAIASAIMESVARCFRLLPLSPDNVWARIQCERAAEVVAGREVGTLRRKEKVATWFRETTPRRTVHVLAMFGRPTAVTTSAARW